MRNLSHLGSAASRVFSQLEWATTAEEPPTMAAAEESLVWAASTGDEGFEIGDEGAEG